MGFSRKVLTCFTCKRYLYFFLLFSLKTRTYLSVQKVFWLSNYLRGKLVQQVNLVSEHVWCDDYLVRSFYLKNVRTGETRTISQFHFLSWPESGIPASTKALLEFRRSVLFEHVFFHLLPFVSHLKILLLYLYSP